MRWALPLIFLSVAGCSLPTTTLLTADTRPHEQVGGGILRVALPKSGLAECASSDECILVKAAEATQRVGGTHFMVLPGHGGSTQKGSAYIKVFTFGADEGVPSNAMSVEEALYFFRRPQGKVTS